MIAVWMLYCLAIGVAFSVVGYALERALHFAGHPTRWAWIVALVGSYVIPAAAWLRPEAFAKFAAPIPMIAESSPSAPPLTTSITSSNLHQSPLQLVALTDLDTPLRWAWAGASGALIIALAAAATRLVALRRRWRYAAVDGRQVLVSPDIGPAVVGVWSPRVVLPEWALKLPEHERELMLAHEEHHVRAADPAVIAIGFALVLLTPWNVALWWQWRRLRLAVEMDCDARVLNQGRSPSAYGELLLRVGGRRSRQLLGLAAFGEPVSFLESRIRRMLAGVPRRRWAGVALALAVAIGAVVGACETPRPVAPAESVESAVASRATFAGVVSVETAPTDRTRVEQAPAVLLAPRMIYPDLPRLAGIQGRVVVQARIDPSGRAEPASVTVLESPHPALAQAAKSAALRSRFRPARAHGQAVAAVALITYEFVDAATRTEAARDLSDRLGVQESERLRPSIERSARRMFPSILEGEGPPMDAFLVADARLQVYRGTLTTLHYLGTNGARPDHAIDLAELKQAVPSFDPGHDGWLVVDPRALQGLVRNNVRVIWIHHDQQGEDAAQNQGTRIPPELERAQRHADFIRQLGRQAEPEVLAHPTTNAAIALIVDAEYRVIAHASGVRKPTDQTCLDVLKQLLPGFQNARFPTTGCMDADAQGKVALYWGQLASR